MVAAGQRVSESRRHQAPHLTQYTAPTGFCSGPTPCSLQLEWCNKIALVPGSLLALWGPSVLSYLSVNNSLLKHSLFVLWSRHLLPDRTPAVACSHRGPLCRVTKARVTSQACRRTICHPLLQSSVSSEYVSSGSIPWLWRNVLFLLSVLWP